MDALSAQASPKRREGLHSKASYKRLERGKFVWPPLVDGTMTLTPAQLALLIEAMDWRRTIAPPSPAQPMLV